MQYPADLEARGRDLARRIPFTLTYTGVILSTSVARALWPQQVANLTDDFSTNVRNLDHHPLRALVGSALIVDGSVGLNLLLGITPMAVAERRIGPRAAATMFIVGHVGATVLTASTIHFGLARGYYGREVTRATDVGLSYGAIAVRFAAIGAETGTKRQLVDATRAGTLLGLTAPWRLPRDFTSTGHVIAAAIGTLGAIVIGLRRRRRNEAHSDATLSSPASDAT